jgi:hypothetical protein
MTLFVLVVVAYPFLYAMSGLTWLTSEPRYVVLVAPALVLLVAKPATTLPRAAAMLAIFTLLSAAVLVRWISWSHDDARAVALDPHYLKIEPAIEALDRAGVDRAFAGYWLAYRITFDTRERIIVSEWDLQHLRQAGRRRVVPPVPRDYREHHHPAYDRAVREAPRHAYLVVRGELDEEKTRRDLREHGYRETSLGNLYLLVSPPQQG